MRGATPSLPRSPPPRLAPPRPHGPRSKSDPISTIATRTRVRDVITHLLQRHDTTTERADVAAIADAYSTLSDRGRVRFFAHARPRLLDRPGRRSIARSRPGSAATGEPSRRGAERALRAALTPPAARLLQLFTGLDDGVKFLVDLRADELRLAADPDDHHRRRGRARPSSATSCKAQLAMLFDVGLLELRRITWDAPAALLEKLIEYEAVHTIGSWADLKNRLDSDRRCYAFFHPAMPDEPLVFVEIALTTGTPCELAPLLDAHAPDLDPDHADTAVFYSISNCQPGLAGVNLGTALIEQVVEQLRRDLPQLQRFVTLSPIPGYRAWLDDRRCTKAISARTSASCCPPRPSACSRRLVARRRGTPTKRSNPRSSRCAPATSRRSRDGRALDPVANFHLANGAMIAADQLARRPEPDRARALGQPHGQLRLRARSHRGARRGASSPAARSPMSNAVRELLGKSGALASAAWRS